MELKKKKVKTKQDDMGHYNKFLPYKYIHVFKN